MEDYQQNAGDNERERPDPIKIDPVGERSLAKKKPRESPRGGWDGGGNLSLFLKKEYAYYSTSTYLFK